MGSSLLHSLPLLVLMAGLSVSKASIFVAHSSSGCSDNGPGTQAAPLCTIAAALAKSRRASSAAAADSDVVLRAGTFVLTSALRLTETDSGLTLRAFAKERVTVSGGMVITGWKETATKGIWSAPIPASCKCAVGGMCGPNSCMAYSSPRQLYVGGRRANRTSANASVLLGDMRLSTRGSTATPPPQTPAGVMGPSPTNGGGAYVVSKPVLKGWGSATSGLASTDMEFVYPAQIVPWTEPRCGIKNISEDGLTLHMQDCLKSLPIKPGCASGPTANSTICPRRWFMAGLPGLIENSLQLLTADKPGEFYVDRSTAAVFYVPHKNEDLQTVEVVLPLLETLLDSDGAHRLTISGIDWMYTAWGGPDQPCGYVPTQAGWAHRPAIEPHSLGPIHKPLPSPAARSNATNGTMSITTACSSALQGCWPVRADSKKCQACEATQRQHLHAAGCSEEDIVRYCGPAGSPGSSFVLGAGGVSAFLDSRSPGTSHLVSRSNTAVLNIQSDANLCLNLYSDAHNHSTYYAAATTAVVTS